MRARNIKPGFFQNVDMFEVSPVGRLLFIGLWCMADREGRLEERIRQIKFNILPMDDIEIEPLLGELETWGFLKRYDVDGKKYIEIENFTKHQRPHPNESESIIPSPEGLSTMVESTVNHGAKHVAPDNAMEERRRSDIRNEELRMMNDEGGAPREKRTTPAAEESERETVVIDLLQQVRGLDLIDRSDILVHLHEIERIREAGFPQDIYAAEALKFRDHHNEKRANQPKDKKWTNWKNALTNWFRKLPKPAPSAAEKHQVWRKPKFAVDLDAAVAKKEAEESAKKQETSDHELSSQPAGITEWPFVSHGS